LVIAYYTVAEELNLIHFADITFTYSVNNLMIVCFTHMLEKKQYQVALLYVL